MEKSALSTIAAVLLVLYSLINMGAALGQFAKAKTAGEAASFAASVGEMAGDRAGADRLRGQGMSASLTLHLLAVFILATAVLEMAGAVGLFSGRPWAVNLVTLAAICGALVEFQDMAEDGFGAGKLVFLAINLIALVAAQSGRTAIRKAA